MVLLEKNVLKSFNGLKQQSFLYLSTESETTLFDCPSIMWGSDFRLPSFESPQKKLKFLVPNFNNVERIFVSSSESMGILFIKEDIDIYITLPVYEQILAKYYSLLDLKLTYDDQELKDNYSGKIATIDDINIERVKKNIKFIIYNERIFTNGIRIDCNPSGIFVGWCTFICRFSSKSLHITNKVTKKRKFAIEYKHEPADLEVNLNDVQHNCNSIDDFNKKVLSVKDKSLIIACDIPTAGIDLMFHLLYVFKGNSGRIPLYIIFSELTEYINNLSNHAEWMAQPIKINTITNNFQIIENLTFIDRPSIVLVDTTYIHTLCPGDYEILTIGEVIMKNSLFKFDPQNSCHNFMFLDSYFIPTDCNNLILNRRYTIDFDEKIARLNFKNTLRDFDGESLYLAGKITNTDRNTPETISSSVNGIDMSLFNYLFENEIYFYHEKSYFFPRYGFHIKENEDKTFKLVKN